MIEMSLQELLNSVPVLKKIVDKEMNAKTAYWFARIIKEVEKETEAFSIAQKGLVNKYGMKDEEGKFIEKEQGISIVQEKLDDFNKEANELLKTKVKIDYEPINIENLEELNFSPSDIGLIINYIKK